MTLVAILLSVLVGVSLGLLGGGGSILMVPILVIVVDMDPKVAIATSLLVVGSTAAVGAIQHWRAGRVDIRTGLVFGGAGMAGAYVGGRVAEFIPGDWLLVAFGIMMAVTAVAMLRDRRAPTPVRADDGSGDPGHRHTGRIIIDGVVVGMITGLVGAGGGFLVVPALVLLGGLSMPVAVGTSLLVIAMKSAAGLAGYLASVDLDWPLALAVTAAAIGGSFIGTRLVDRTNPDRLRRGFGWFVVAAAILVLAQQVPSAWTQWLPGSALAWAAIPIAIVAVVAFLDLRSHAAQGDPTQDEPGQDDPAQDDPTQDEPAQDEPGQDGAGPSEHAGPEIPVATRAAAGSTSAVAARRTETP